MTNYNNWQPHYTDNPYPEDQPRTEDTCWSCYEADSDVPHTGRCMTLIIKPINGIPSPTCYEAGYKL